MFDVVFINSTANFQKLLHIVSSLVVKLPFSLSSLQTGEAAGKKRFSKN